MREYRAAHPAYVKKENLEQRKRRAKNLEAVRARDRRYHYTSSYGEGSQDYLHTQMKKQKGCCVVCGDPMERPCLDHNHKTKQWRGALCNSCNRMLGYARDSVCILRKAIAYLSKWNKK